MDTDTPLIDAPDMPEPDEAAVKAAEDNMRALDLPTHEKVQEDYFAFDETHIVKLPDGISFIEHKTLTEGQRRQYLNSINRDVVIRKATGDASLKMAPGDERWALLKVAITGWNLQKGGKPLPFSKGSPGSNLEQFLEAAPPKIVDLIDKEVRKVNAWLIEDMSVEDIDKEIQTLTELRQAKLDAEAGNSSS